MDGVLINSEPLWEEQDVLHFSKLFPGYKNASAEYRGKGHLGVYELLKIVMDFQCHLRNFVRFVSVIVWMKFFQKHHLCPVCGNFRTIFSSLSFAVGTSSVQEAVDSVFVHHALAPYFSCGCHSRRCTTSGKTSPDIFLKAAENWGFLLKNVLC